MTDTKICCICEKEYDEWPNNALPVMVGFCCDECNETTVMEARTHADSFGEKL